MLSIANSSRNAPTSLSTMLVVVLCGGAWSFGQDDRPSPVPDDAMARPTEYGIRFTPRMARALSDEFTNNLLRGHYELPEDKVEEASEAVARRLMELAHTADKEGRGRDLAEFAVVEFLRVAAETEPGEGLDGMPQGLAVGIGQRMLPMMPAVHDLIKNVGQDIRPMLPMKQQLKLARDLIAVKTGADAFEASMKRWAEGDVDPYGNPFEDGNKEIDTDENGESEALKQARQQAQDRLERKQWSDWEEYVKEAKTYYGFDESQSATADSILRELTERAEATARDEQWRGRAYQHQVLAFMYRALDVRWNNPLRVLADDCYQQLEEPFKELEAELKRRIDEVPTNAQRTAAEERIMAALTNLGFDPHARDAGAEETAHEKTSSPEEPKEPENGNKQEKAN